MQYGFLGLLLGMNSSVQRPWDLCTWSKSNLVIGFHPYPMPWHCYDTSISNEVLYKRLQTSWRPVLPASLRSPLPSTCQERTSPKLIKFVNWQQSFYSYTILPENSKVWSKFTLTCQRLDRQAPPADGMASRSAWSPPPGTNTMVIISMVEVVIVLDYK